MQQQFERQLDGGFEQLDEKAEKNDGNDNDNDRGSGRHERFSFSVLAKNGWNDKTGAAYTMLGGGQQPPQAEETGKRKLSRRAESDSLDSA